MEADNLAKSGRYKILPQGQSACKALSLKSDNIILNYALMESLLFRNSDASFTQQFIATLLLTLSDFKLHKILPPVTDADKSITLLFVGASAHYELSMDFQAYFEPLKNTYYPDLQL